MFRKILAQTNNMKDSISEILSACKYNANKLHKGKIIQNKNALSKGFYSFLKQLLFLTQPVSQSLTQKYSLSYIFFTAKYINQLVYSVGNPLSIQFDNLKAYHEDTEYLRRSYRHASMNGRKQIEERIKIVAKYYENEGLGGWNALFVTESKINEIFIKRTKHLRKLKQKNSYSPTQQSASSLDGNSQSFSLQLNFLKDVNLQYSELMNDSSSLMQHTLDFSLDSHDIYENFNPEPEQVNTFQNFHVNQSAISHLICDFEEIDVESAINFYKDIKKSKNGSIILSEILEQEQKLSKKTSKQKKNQNQPVKKLSLQYPQDKKGSKTSKQSILSTYMSIFGRKPQLTKKSKTLFIKQKRQSINLIKSHCINKQTKTYQTEQNEEEVEKQKLKQKQARSKIRQKAEKLLTILTKQSSTPEFR